MEVTACSRVESQAHAGEFAALGNVTAVWSWSLLRGGAWLCQMIYVLEFWGGILGKWGCPAEGLVARWRCLPPSTSYSRSPVDSLPLDSNIPGSQGWRWCLPSLRSQWACQVFLEACEGGLVPAMFRWLPGRGECPCASREWLGPPSEGICCGFLLGSEGQLAFPFPASACWRLYVWWFIPPQT